MDLIPNILAVGALLISLITMAALATWIAVDIYEEFKR